jgi:hypothetical protein
LIYAETLDWRQALKAFGFGMRKLHIGILLLIVFFLTVIILSIPTLLTRYMPVLDSIYSLIAAYFSSLWFRFLFAKVMVGYYKETYKKS